MAPSRDSRNSCRQFLRLSGLEGIAGGFIPTFGGFGGVASDPQPPVSLLHRAEQITNLCRCVIPAFTWKTSSIMPLRQYASRPDSVEQYLADERTRAAVERVLEVCGEAMSNLYRMAPTVAGTIPHARDIIGFRNILAHGYAELDHNKVYNIAIAHAPQLLLAVREALKAFPDPPSPL
jgi:uncharacterized protein with HEPN domain